MKNIFFTTINYYKKNSYILRFLNFMLNLFRPLKIIIDSDNVFLDLPWYTTRTKGISLKSKSSGLEIFIEKKIKDQSFYIIQNATTHHFKKLVFTEGVSVEKIAESTLSCFGLIDNTLSCSLLILEYNSKNDRIGTFKTSLNTSSIYKPSKNTVRCVLCLYVSGYGRCLLYGIRIKTNNLKIEEVSNNINNCYNENKKTIKKEQNLSYIAFNALIELAKNIPISNGSTYFKKIPLNIAIITDLFMFNFYKDTFEKVYYLSPDNYDEILSSKRIDILLYVTCWKGINFDEWKGIKFRDKPSNAFEKIIELARFYKAKIVFQSIEDPSNFDYFIPIAKKFDYIFTSDIDCIDKYINECNHKNVFYAEYGINPHLHNPIGCRRHLLNVFFFAGSWANRYKDRCDDMELIFDSILSSKGKLLIADRNLNSSEEISNFPVRFQNCILNSVDHNILQSLIKIFRFNLNFNSIKNSPTMCAMRIYEMQAMGVDIYSNYAKSVYNNFPEIRLISRLTDLSDDFAAPETIEEYRKKMHLVSNVMNDKTSYDIAADILQKIQLTEISFSKPNICIIYKNNDIDFINKIIDKQEYKSCIIVDEKDINSKSKWEYFLKKHNIKFFTWFNQKYDYEKNYIFNLINGFKYTKARYVTHLAWFDGDNFHDGPQHEYTQIIGAKVRTIFSAEDFSPEDFIYKDDEEEIQNVSGGYAIDPFELNYSRYMDIQKLKNTNFVPNLSVIVPTFNNGRFLRSKCIESLKRNYCWNDIEVLIIDDGSTDPDTIYIIHQLDREHFNIRTFFYNDGGSGSASRPRNKGIVMAKAPLIAFLDPDNEISPRGYDNLIQLYKQTVTQHVGVDFVTGYQVKVHEQIKIIGKFSDQSHYICDNLKKNFLESGKFPVISTQAAVISAKLLQNSHLRFVENAAGQDTLFGWELLCQAEVGVFTDLAYLIYYAQRKGSIVNEIDSSYFQKHLILEREQIAMLKRNGLLDVYLSKKYDHFLNYWYLDKLNQVKDAIERNKSIIIIKKIANLYGKDFDINILNNIK
jgi:glycosyltransferase involved in cell wall biosynthesis